MIDIDTWFLSLVAAVSCCWPTVAVLAATGWHEWRYRRCNHDNHDNHKRVNR